MRILLTGERGVGKSTLARRIFEILGTQPAGFQTFPVFENGRKMGYLIKDLMTGRERLFAHRAFVDGPRFGNFHVHDAAFTEFGVDILNNLDSAAAWVLLDEVGVMEKNAVAFLLALTNLWQSPRNQFWVVQKRSPFLNTLAALNRPFFRFEITHTNRDALVEKILRVIQKD